MKKIYNKNKSAFTLIELLVVIAIIGILTALAVVSLQNLRRSARDAKRLSDVKQIQIALELYYQDNGIYPPTLIPGETLSSNTITYMETIPYPPTTLDGDCSTTSYIYSTSNDNTYYNIHFCISNNIGSLPAGNIVASPRGLGTWTCGERLLDDRDNQSYATVQIGSQCWMAENLNIGTMVQNTVTTTAEVTAIEKYCYSNLESNCDIYGGLYQWDEAMNYVETEGAQGICPDGWHIPSSTEWTVLTDYVNSNIGYRCNGINNYITKSLASAYDWNSTTTLCVIGNNQSTNNITGFNALPAGIRRYTDGAFISLRSHAYFWLSSPSGTNAPNRRLYYHLPEVGSGTDYRAYGFSVRCLKTD
jgi:uncharacterized protein (TIGR02145 family)/prepilin-type N-terminal cleavage/methylation domain-containing protein